MSKALELLANIDKKYNNELKNTEEQLLSGIEQTSQTIRDSLNIRANITATAIQQSDEKIAQSIQNNAQTVEKQLSLYQTLLQSKLSHLTQLNEQIQSQEQQAQNQAVQKKLTTLNMGLISVAVILLIAIFSLGLVTKNKYSEMQTLNTVINEKQNEGRPFEPIGRQFDDQHMQATRQQKHSAYVFRSTRTQANGRTAT
ncbi:hypothetical protein [Acinetobacter baumannii]|uniref:hypothetical protein n=1 Tax=Acinetobacter baumannii TaxID=470 RepID=UPI001D18B98E|nr:hypothetical protein [Acinetobacter baumannii]